MKYIQFCIIILFKGCGTDAYLEKILEKQLKQHMMPFYIIPELTERLDSFEDYPSVKRWIWISPSSHCVRLAILSYCFSTVRCNCLFSFSNYLWNNFVGSWDQIHQLKHELCCLAVSQSCKTGPAKWMTFRFT